MSTPVRLTAEIGGGLLILGLLSLLVLRQALKDGWVRFSISFAAIPPGKRWDTGKKDTDAVAGAGEGEGTVSPSAESVAPAAVPAVRRAS